MRPCKPRRIGGLPPFTRYMPQEGPADGEVRLGLDMLEALRLVDAEGRPQDEAAAAMDVSTATLCRILGEARRQVATALSQGRNIVIEGGNVMFGESCGMRHRCGHGPHGVMGRTQESACGGRGQGRGAGGGHAADAGQERGRGMGRGCGHGHGGGPRAGQCRRGRDTAQEQSAAVADTAAAENDPCGPARCGRI